MSSSLASIYSGNPISFFLRIAISWTVVCDTVFAVECFCSSCLPQNAAFCGRHDEQKHSAKNEMRIPEEIDAKLLDIYLAQFSCFSNRPFLPPSETDQTHRVQPTERTEHVVTYFLINLFVAVHIISPNFSNQHIYSIKLAMLTITSKYARPQALQTKACRALSRLLSKFPVIIL